MIVVGGYSSKGLRFVLRWDRVEEPRTATEATRGELAAWIGDTPIWGIHEAGRFRGLAWSWVELLEFLAHAWRYLEWEEATPLGLSSFPDQLRTVAEARWADLPVDRQAVQERALCEYEETHNLAAGLQGLYAEPLWIQRTGECAWIVARGVRAWRPYDETFETLEGLGDAIVARLRAVKSEPRAMAVMESWQQRRNISVEEYVAVATGMTKGTLSELVGKGSAEKLFDVSEVGRDSEILAAARMIGTTLPSIVTRRVFERIRKVARRDTPELDALSSEAIEELRGAESDVAHDQGTRLATWLRARLGVKDTQAVDPRALLSEWRVPVLELDLEVSTVDALGCWGPAHGPVVFLNPSGRHCRSDASRRATLAHEVCHLLVDRRTALPLAEVMGGRLPPIVEPRARAFAAAFLVPESAAAEIAGVSPSRIRREVRRVAKRYGASQELVAWRVRNSAASVPPSNYAYLKSLVTDQARF